MIKKILYIVVAVILSVNAYSQFQNSLAPTSTSTDNFTADVYCTHLLYPNGSSCDLGKIFADDHTYTCPLPGGYSNSLLFTLEGQDPGTFPATYTVTCTQMDLSVSAGAGTIDINAHWELVDANNNPSTPLVYVSNEMFSKNNVELITATSGPCDAYATFKVIVDDITATDDASPGSYSFNMTVTASLNGM